MRSSGEDEPAHLGVGPLLQPPLFPLSLETFKLLANLSWSFLPLHHLGNAHTHAIIDNWHSAELRHNTRPKVIFLTLTLTLIIIGKLK